MSLDSVYQARRQQLQAATARRIDAIFAATYTDQAAAVAQITQVEQAGQKHMVALVDAYMAAKAAQAVGSGVVQGLDPALYTTGLLRGGVTAADMYGRAFTVLTSELSSGVPLADALKSARDLVEKIARTDLQLAQTHAARDWMAADARIVGYRRVLTPPGPHCALCEAASTRTYRKADLMAIHERCTCTVEPLWGFSPVGSVGTKVRVEQDPELGPRLMAADWSTVGPRLIEQSL